MNEDNIQIPVFYGTCSDLTKLDMSFINAKIEIFNGRNFRKAFLKFFEPMDFNRYYHFVTMSNDRNFFTSKFIKLYAVIPIDQLKPFKIEDIYHYFDLLLTIFPSDLRLVRIINLKQNAEKFQFTSSSDYSFNPTGETYFDNFLSIYRSEFTFIKNFTIKYFFSSRKLNYVNYILTLYRNSFFENNPIYQFISLMICLEVVVEGKEQLTYKIKRNVAILCGRDVPSCRLIYKNIDQLYKLRSAIVHGEIKPSFDNFEEYQQYLKKLVSKLLRELIVHDIATIELLNEKLTEIGYSQNNLLSKNYIYSKFPILDNLDLTQKVLQKYKN